MEFYSTMASARYVLVPSSLDFIPVEGGKFHRKRTQGITVEFEPLDPASEGIPWHGVNLVPRGGRVRGRFVTDDPDLINALREHPKYGKDFIAVAEDGRELVDEDYYFITLPDGRVMFTLTGRKFANMQGAKGWKQSKEFQEAIEKERQRIRETYFS